ncbi:hypothetical protein E3T23_14480 [Cryobacterium cheniae]|uniref:DUF559 domain-containing protein n=1 Tax=Cryobacterium cheniae TaxID=1259262 RepID=A0A4R8XM59_9MICO|nr:hypothetical protein E3T23_14480 [Cryobacterium cheniae]
MRPPSELPPELGDGPFSVADAHQLGVNSGRLRRSDLARPFYGVRAPLGRGQSLPPTSDADRWARIRAAARTRAEHYAVQMPADQFFSHATAALLHGLPLPIRLLEQSIVDVGTSVRTRRRRGKGVRGHFIPLDRVRIVRVGHLSVASAVDAWVQLSTVLTLDELIILGDSLVRRQRPPSTMAELCAAVARQAGLPGARRLREALILVRPRTDSPKETVLRLLIVRAGLPEPEVNVTLRNRFGAFMALGDLAYRRYKVLIEYDGGQHREDERQFHRDIDRLDEPMEEGWRVIRVNKSHLPQAIIARIRTALLDRGWVP